jgi:hypothetical protein
MSIKATEIEYSPRKCGKDGILEIVTVRKGSLWPNQLYLPKFAAPVYKLTEKFLFPHIVALTYIDLKSIKFR